MLLGWATTLPAKDPSMLLDTWRMHVDADRETATTQERFDQRSVHLSKLLDGVGRLDGTLDPDGYRDIVPIDTIRPMACDCNMHRYLADPTGHIIDYGRKRRFVSDIQFDLLLIRDHGCRWRGCNILAAAATPTTPNTGSTPPPAPHPPA